MQEVLAEQSLYRNIVISISMLLFVILGVSRLVYPKLFASLYGFEKFFVFRYRDDFGSGIRLFSTESFFFTAVLSLNFSFALLCLYLFSEPIHEVVNADFSPTFWQGISIWLVLSIAIQFLFFVKFLFIRVFGWMFDIPLEQTRHFQEFQAFNHSFSLLVFFLLSVSIFIRYSFPVFSFNILGFAVCIYLFFRLINLFFKIRSIGACSNLYIFSYLCSTELLPTLIGVFLII